MQALEFPVQIDVKKQIHLQLPTNITAQTARVIVMYENPTDRSLKPIKLGLFNAQLTMTDDFNEPLTDEFWLAGDID